MGDNPESCAASQGRTGVIPDGPRRVAAPMMEPMTTDQPNAQRLLRRRSDDGVIGGVASGIGEYLNVDPLLIRIAFVGLIVFGGLGLLLYVLAWAVVPEEASQQSIVEQVLVRLRFSPRRILAGGVLLLGVLVFATGIGGEWGAVVGGIVVVVLGITLLRESDGRTSVAAARPERAAATVVARPERVLRRRAPKVRSPLGWYVLAGILVAIGALALVTNVSGADVDLGQFFGIGLGVLGVGLVIGTWWGRARRLIVLGVFALPFAVASSFVTAPIQGGFGDHEYRPANVSELRDAYRLVGGRLVLDLRDVEASGDPIVIGVSVAFGQLKLVLPEDASIELDADVGAGELGVLGAWQTGSGLADRYVREGGGPRFILDVEMGMGSAWVTGRPVEGR